MRKLDRAARMIEREAAQGLDKSRGAPATGAGAVLRRGGGARVAHQGKPACGGFRVDDDERGGAVRLWMLTESHGNHAASRRGNAAKTAKNAAATRTMDG